MSQTLYKEKKQKLSLINELANRWRTCLELCFVYIETSGKKQIGLLLTMKMDIFFKFLTALATSLSDWQTRFYLLTYLGALYT